MPKIERRRKDFELRGHLNLIRTGTSSSGADWAMIAVSGFSFFLDPVWIPELLQLDEGIEVVVRGEYAGERIRNGQRVASFDVLELERVGGVPEASRNGADPIPRISKQGQAM